MKKFSRFDLLFKKNKNIKKDFCSERKQQKAPF